VDEGRRIVATNVGVFATNNIGQANPRWYDCNAGIPAGQERCWKIIRDPWHWWSSGGGERTLWGLFGDDTRPNEEPRYVYKMEGFPHGTWAASLDCQTLALNPNPAWEHFGIDIVGTIEVADLLYLAVQHHTAGLDTTEGWLIASPDGGGSWNDLGQFTAVGVPDTIGFPTWPGSPFRIGLANHSAASTIYIYQSYMTPGNDLCVRKSSNGGGTWNTQAPLIGPWAMDVWGGITVPYQSPTWNDRDIVVRMAQPLNDIKALQRSTDGGTSWGAIGEAVPMAYRAHSIPSSDKDTIAVLLASAGNSEIRITTDGGVSWATWATMPWLAGCCAQFDWAEGSGGAGAALKSVLVPRMDGGFEGVYLVTAGGTVSDRTGNLRGFGVTSFSKIERDTMGAA